MNNLFSLALSAVGLSLRGVPLTIFGLELFRNEPNVIADAHIFSLFSWKNYQRQKQHTDSHKNISIKINIHFRWSAGSVLLAHKIERALSAVSSGKTARNDKMFEAIKSK